MRNSLVVWHMASYDNESCCEADTDAWRVPVGVLHQLQNYQGSFVAGLDVVSRLPRHHHVVQLEIVAVTLASRGLDPIFHAIRLFAVYQDRP